MSSDSTFLPASDTATRTGKNGAQPRPLLLETLSRFVGQIPGDDRFLLVAFSGGPDSTALLWGLAQVADALGLRLHAAHLDHGLDADSSRRATAARDIAVKLDVPITVERLRTPRPDTESLEAFARRHRYTFLHRLADRLEAPRIATAHHADDQAETVLLRLLFGSGLEGLGAMSQARGRVVRPLLSCYRTDLCRALAASGITPVNDPTNSELTTPRNAIRSRLLPHLEAQEPGTTASLCRLAAATRRASRRLERRIESLLALKRLTTTFGRKPRGVEVDRQALENLPEPLLPVALAWLHRRAGAPYPASSAARRELLRQVRADAGLGCDCGRGWRWEGNSKSIRLVHNASSPGRITYNLIVPGSVDVPELALRVRLTRGKVAPWMYSGRIYRTGLAGVDLEACTVVVRNRRPGDRIQPLGSSRRRRLKDLLIDRRVPRPERDRLPLLVVDGEIAWVPGITIGERFRLGEEPTAWIAEIEDLRAQSDNPRSFHPSFPRMGADGKSPVGELTKQWNERSTER